VKVPKKLDGLGTSGYRSQCRFDSRVVRHAEDGQRIGGFIETKRITRLGMGMILIRADQRLNNHMTANSGIS
jgi:hypothetical protein